MAQPPSGWLEDANSPGWYYDPEGDPNQPESWWQMPPDGFEYDPNSPHWALRVGGDPQNQADWWHDDTVQEPSDATAYFTPDEIHTVSYGAPLDNIVDQWPLLAQGFAQAGAPDLYTAIATLATIRVECPPFWPIHEYGDDAYFTRLYEGRSDLGNVYPGDGARYCGRGLLQLTGRANYRNYGQRLGIDLESNPDLALDPEVSARVFVLYFTDRDLCAAAQRGDWQRVRTGVNGGLNGWDTFIGAVNAYLDIARGKGLI